MRRRNKELGICYALLDLGNIVEIIFVMETQLIKDVTMLAPTGLVEITGKNYEAFCQSGLAQRGASLTVIGFDNFRVIVSENKTP